MPTTKPEFEFAVMIELPIVTTAGGLDVVGLEGFPATGDVDGDGFAGLTTGTLEVVCVGSTVTGDVEGDGPAGSTVAGVVDVEGCAGSTGAELDCV